MLNQKMFKKTVCIVAPVHPSTDIRVYQKEAKTLANHGYRVVLFAFNAFKGEDTVQDEVEICCTNYRTRFERFLNIPKIFWRVCQLKADVYHLHNPDTLPIGFMLKILGKKVIYDTHEDFAKRILLKYWIPTFLRRIVASIVETLEKLAGTFFSAVIVTQPEVQKRIGGKAYVLENAPISRGPLIDESYCLSKTIAKDNVFRVIYAGGISMTRGLEEMVQAVGLLNNHLPAQLWLCGSVENSRDLERVMSSSYGIFVEYLGLLRQSHTFAHLIKANAGLVTIKDVCDYSQSSANKLYEYMLFGLPFVASNFKKWQKQLKSVRAGFFVNPHNPEEIAEALWWIATHPDESEEMGRRGKKFIEVVYNWEQESKKLLALYDKLLKRQKDKRGQTTC